MSTYNFFWIASQRYVKEARKSTISVREHHPDASLTLFTDSIVTSDMNAFDRIITIEPIKSKYWFLRSTHYMQSALFHYDPGEKIVYLDTDTYVCAPLDDIFAALDRFDFVGAHAPGRQTANTVDEIPESFPEYNIGVQGIRNSEEMQRLFSEWASLYEKNKDIYRNNDQAPLREVIWNYRTGKLSFGTLPTEFNFRFGMGGQIRGKVRVLHGRSYDYENLESIVNKDSWSIRSWEKGKLV